MFVLPDFFYAYLFLLACGSVIIGLEAKKRYWLVLLLMAIAAIYLFVVPRNYLIFSQNILPSFLIFLGLFLLGIICGLLMVFAKSNKFLNLLAIVSPTVATLTLLAIIFTTRAASPYFGWGLFLVPPVVAGNFLTYALLRKWRDLIIYLGCWLLTMAIIVGPNFLSIMAGDEDRIFYSTTDFDKNLYVQSEIMTTFFYVTGALLLLYLPSLISRFFLQKRLCTENF